MRIPGIKAARQSIQWLHSRFRPHALILGYHRVADDHEDPYGICVSPAHFAAHMAILQAQAQVIQLGELVQGLQVGKLPDRSVAITFDDGYADLLQTVKPVLENLDIPCTVFIVTGSLGLEYWWDEIERLQSGGGLTGEVHQGTSYEELLSLPLAERQRAINVLRERSGADLVESTLRSMTLDELIELSNCSLIEIGAHGANHLSLSHLPDDEQTNELLESRHFLERNLGKAIHGFSYPNGSFSELTKNLAQECGYTYACQSRPGPVFAHSDLYQLPRFWIPDWDGATFRRWLVKWL